jgi:hypothetical protein
VPNTDPYGITKPDTAGKPQLRPVRNHTVEKRWGVMTFNGMKHITQWCDSEFIARTFRDAAPSKIRLVSQEITNTITYDVPKAERTNP